MDFIFSFAAFVGSHRQPGAAHLQNGSVTEMAWPTNSDYLEVYVSAVEHPEHMWVQLLNSAATQLDRLIADMTRIYTNPDTEVRTDPLFVGGRGGAWAFVSVQCFFC